MAFNKDELKETKLSFWFALSNHKILQNQVNSPAERKLQLFNKTQKKKLNQGWAIKLPLMHFHLIFYLLQMVRNHRQKQLTKKRKQRDFNYLTIQ